MWSDNPAERLHEFHRHLGLEVLTGCRFTPSTTPAVR
jgi:hypothetical protein